MEPKYQDQFPHLEISENEKNSCHYFKAVLYWNQKFLMISLKHISTFPKVSLSNNIQNIILNIFVNLFQLTYFGGPSLSSFFRFLSIRRLKATCWSKSSRKLASFCLTRRIKLFFSV